MESGPKKPILLVIDDERHIRRAVRAVAMRQGCEVLEAATGEEGLELLDTHDVTCAFVDHLLPGMLGIDVLRRAVLAHPNVAYVLFTSGGDADIGFQAHKLGADYTTKRGGTDWLLETLHKALRAGQLLRENARLREVAQHGAGLERSPADRLLLGPSMRMEAVREEVRKYAKMARQHILILGESGVGKEVCAKALHAQSGHPGRMVTLNAGAIAPSLAESELFGHERGAFTGADRVKVGAFEHAGDGIVFLDEIGDLPPNIQVKLLRVLEDGTYSRVGSTEQRVFRGRVIAATDRPLDEMIEQGTFRPQLRWRFGFTIELPALRDHIEDVPILAMRFLKEHCDASQRAIRNITRDAMHCLQAYRWENNNVRELRNAMAHGVASAEGDLIEVHDLPTEIQAAGRGRARTSSHLLPPRAVGPGPVRPPPTMPGPRMGPALSLHLLDLAYKGAKKEAQHVFARWFLLEKLVDHEGNITRAAEGAGMMRPNFHRLMKQHLSPSDMDEVRRRIGGVEDPAAK